MAHEPHPSSPTFSQLAGHDSEFQLNSEVEEKMKESTRLEKVAFMSGRERSYFPGDVGYSKFAIEEKPSGDPSYPPAMLYVSPDEDRLQKPHSLKGYGMGGLCGPRFYVDKDRIRFPAPNKYQMGDHAFRGKEHRFPPQVWLNYGLLRTDMIRKHMASDTVNTKLTTLWNNCQQVRAPFLTSMKRPRFGKEPKQNIVGPGHYNVRTLSKPKGYVSNSFLNGPAQFNPPTKLHCSYGPKEPCIECGKELMRSEDYYRAKFKLRLPPADAVDEDDHSISLPQTKLKQEDEVSPKRRRVLLCRACYCKAMRGESKYWSKKKDIEWIFEKTRHCSYIHEHNGLPDYTQKIPCYWAKRLTRKEATLSKYYPDKCGGRILKKKA